MRDTSLPVSPDLLHAWLAGRSLARGLPAPVPDCGGFRVDTRSDSETARWVFPAVTPDVIRLAREIAAPGYLIKSCVAPEALQAALPDGWRIEPPGYFMSRPAAAPTVHADTGDASAAHAASTDAPAPLATAAIARARAAGYRVQAERDAAVLHVRVLSGDGELAASGYAADTRAAFVYDRIVTAPEHRRKGLASIVMATLGAGKQHADAPEVLVATEAGRLLYEALGWHTLSIYSTGTL